MLVSGDRTEITGGRVVRLEKGSKITIQSHLGENFLFLQKL